MEGGRFRFYALRKGRQPGIYTSWSIAKQQVHGFRDCDYRGFKERSDAEAYMPELHVTDFASSSSSSASPAQVVTGHLPYDTLLDVVPEVNCSEFLHTKEMEHLLVNTCRNIGLPEPKFMKFDTIIRQGIVCYSFSVMLRHASTEGANLIATGRFSSAEKRGREDAAFVALE
ncbi:hypothetical protein PIB30_025482 [Stylosanthes scabra]|uniref:Ribonuclease H1 N-terminal domain-containing protein n=1 Tax=Stylosanthes scabra TaxID=79078 RepID=A0ABU6WDM7_9FABA|nr:hypothetical protein [Stylosanthes scabra]